MSDQCQSSRRLRPIRGEERTIPVMEFPARNDRHATQVKTKMQRGKACLISKIYMQEMMQAICVICDKKREGPRRPSLQSAMTDLLVGLLSNESRDVEIVNARSTHHRPREIISRPCYITWWRRGNRCRCSGRRN